jgi:hypothetical protein
LEEGAKESSSSLSSQKKKFAGINLFFFVAVKGENGDGRRRAGESFRVAARVSCGEDHWSPRRPHNDATTTREEIDARAAAYPAVDSLLVPTRRTKDDAGW